MNALVQEGLRGHLPQGAPLPAWVEALLTSLSDEIDRLQMSSRGTPAKDSLPHLSTPVAPVAASQHSFQHAFPFLALRLDREGVVLETLGGNPGAFGLVVDDLSGLNLAGTPGFSTCPAFRSALNTRNPRSIPGFSYDLATAHGKVRHDVLMVPAEADSWVLLMRDVSALVNALETIQARTIGGKKLVETMHEISLVIGADYASSFRSITQLGARALDVARASIWLFNDERSAILCNALYSNGASMENCAIELKTSDYPAYFAALDATRMLVADDAEKDHRTSEFRDRYLRPLGITSMLDTAILVGRHPAGVVCLEHIGAQRQWSAAEQQFAASLADFATIALAEAGRMGLEEQLRRGRGGAAAGAATAGTAPCAPASAAGIPR